MMHGSERIHLLNTYIDNLTKREAVVRIDELASEPGCKYVVTPNIDDIVHIESDAELKVIFDGADLSLCDGKPLVWISESCGKPIKEKVSGRLLLLDVCEMAASKGYPVFLMGAAQGVAEKAKENLETRYPGLNVCGVYSPPFGFEKDNSEITHMNSLVNKSKATILVLAMGGFKQQRYIYANKHNLECNVALCLGAAVDYAAGVVNPIPDWATKNGFAWLFRLLGDPKRLAKRYFVDAFKIVQIILKYERGGSR